MGQYGGSGGGYLVTREFVLDGSGIEINARSKLGLRSFIRAEICEYPGKAVEGFSFDNFKTLALDHDRIPLQWENADVLSLRSRAIFLRFELCDSYLYGFRVTDETQGNV